MITLRRCIATMGTIFICAGCFYTTTDIKTIDQFSRYKIDGPNTLRVMTTDRSLYELTLYSLRDSVLEGSGTKITQTGKSPFTGQFPLSSVVYLQGSEPSFGRTLFALTAIGFIGVCAVDAAQHHGLSVFRPSSGSCPYVYAWDGRQYVLQGEVFGTAFGRALEARTVCMLPATAPQSTVVCVRVSNERPETHYIDAIQALAFEAPKGATVLLDNQHRAWPVLQPQPPLQSPAQLRQQDGVCWTSDLRSTGPGGSNRDVIELTFPCPGDRRTGSLVIHAINTKLVNAVYDMVFGYLGDESLRFLYQVENDSECIRILQEWISDCSLAIEVWRGGRWVCEGRIAPEANAAAFSRIVRVSSEGVTGESLRVRLSSLADMWELDAVALDWTPVESLTPHPLVMRCATQTKAGSVSEHLVARDGNYTVLLPGDCIEMEFDGRQSSPGRTVTYALEATGYLYEWPQENSLPRRSPFETVSYIPEQADPLEVVNFLIRHEELLRPLVYERWRSIRKPVLE
jgi:hypothetical protein